MSVWLNRNRNIYRPRDESLSDHVTSASGYLWHQNVRQADNERKRQRRMNRHGTEERGLRIMHWQIRSRVGEFRGVQRALSRSTGNSEGREVYLD